MISIRNDINANISFAICAMTAVVYGIISYLTPFQMDDLHYYLLPFKDYYLDRGQADFNAYSDFLDAHYRLVNGRLSNLLAPLILSLIPKWLFSAFTGVAVAATVYFTAAIGSCGKRPTVWILLLSLTLASFLLPWHSGAMFGGAYSLNYLWASALILPVIYLFLFRKQCGVATLCGYSLLAFLAGAFHEGISAPILGAMGIHLILNLRHSNRIQIAAFIAMTVGFLMPLCSPALWGRAGKENIIESVPVIKLCALSAAFIIYCVATVAAICFRRWRASLTGHWETLGFCFISAIISGFFMLMFYSGARTFWCGLMMSITGICIVIHLCPYTFVSNRPLRLIMALSMVALLCIHFHSVISWQKRLNDQYNNVVEIFRKSGDGALFMDIIKPTDIPASCNKKVSYRILSESWQMRVISRMYGNGKWLSIIPSELKSIDASKLKKVGQAPDIYIYGTHILTTDPRIGSREGNRDEERFEIYDPSGQQHGMNAIVQHLPESSSGTSWFLLRPSYNSTGADSTTVRIEWKSCQPMQSEKGSEYEKRWG